MLAVRPYTQQATSIMNDLLRAFETCLRSARAAAGESLRKRGCAQGGMGAATEGYCVDGCLLAPLHIQLPHVIFASALTAAFACIAQTRTLAPSMKV